MVRTWESFARSSVTSAVMSLVVEAIGRSRRAWRWKTTSPVAGSTRIAAGARMEGGRGGRARRARERQQQHEPERGASSARRRAAVARRHRESLTRWPAWSVSASSLGFRRWIVASETPVLIEIADSVSPDLTM